MYSYYEVNAADQRQYAFSCPRMWTFEQCDCFASSHLVNLRYAYILYVSVVFLVVGAACLIVLLTCIYSTAVRIGMCNY